MTNLLPAAVGADGRVNLFVGNVSLSNNSVVVADISYHIESGGRT